MAYNEEYVLSEVWLYVKSLNKSDISMQWSSLLVD